MVRLYRTLENIVRKYVAKPLIIGGLVGMLSYGGRVYGNDIFVSRGGGWYGQDIAINNEGKFVVTWDKDNGSGLDVYAQRFDKGGNRIGEEFRVNTFINDDQRRPTVAMNNEGNFIFAWISYDGSSLGVYAQRFNKDGNRLGYEFRVNEYTEDEQYDPAITIDDEGNFIFAWISYDGSGYGVYVQRFDTHGNKLGNEFRVDKSYVSAWGNDVDISSNDNKDFIITWASSWDGHVGGVSAQRFDKDGNRVGNEFQVNTLIEDDQYEPTIAMNNECFAITWTSDSAYPLTFDIYAQRFGKDGNRIGDEFRVNKYNVDHQEWPDIAMNKSTGDYVITWSSRGQDGSGFGIYAQRFGKDGNRIGDEFRVNSHAEGDQWHSKIAMNDNGDFVVVWTAERYIDNIPVNDIYARIFPFYNPADLNKDGYVDFKDFGIFSDNWLAYHP